MGFALFVGALIFLAAVAIFILYIRYARLKNNESGGSGGFFGFMLNCSKNAIGFRKVLKEEC